jgi:hypothetical protein
LNRDLSSEFKIVTGEQLVPVENSRVRQCGDSGKQLRRNGKQMTDLYLIRTLGVPGLKAQRPAVSEPCLFLTKKHLVTLGVVIFPFGKCSVCEKSFVVTVIIRQRVAPRDD